MFSKKKKHILIVVIIYLLFFPNISPHAEQETFSITMMHVNDTHGHTDKFPKVISAINDIRKKDPHALLFHAGDVFSGTLYFTQFKGSADLALMNLMGIDAMVFGNHEFDLGSNERGHRSLAKFVAGANFPILGTNVVFSEDKFLADLVDGTPLVEQAIGGKTYHSIVKQVNGERIGIFGLVSEDTKNIASPMNVMFRDVVETAKNVVEQFEKEGINKIVLLSHIGFDGDPTYGNDLLLARMVDGIDVIIGAHTHTELHEPVVVTEDMEGHEKEPTVIVQAGQYADYLGYLQVGFDDSGVVVDYDGYLLEIGQYEGETKAVEMLEPFKEGVDKFYNEFSGAFALKALPNPRKGGAKGKSVRANETELGNLVTDAMLAKAKAKHPETVIAFQNGGGIRAPILKGEITVGEIIEVLPFGFDQVIVSLTGEEIKEILEHSVRLAPRENGAFLHVAGMRYIYDSTKEPGDRIEKMEVFVEGEGKFVEVEKNKHYVVTTNRFTAQGGDGFNTFAKAYEEGRVHFTGLIDWIVFRDYIVEDLGGRVTHEIEGRIVDRAVRF